MRFIVLTETIPHVITDGCNLRVKNIIEHLSHLLGSEKIGLICPTPAGDVARFRKWAEGHNIVPIYQDKTNDRGGFEPGIVWDIMAEVRHAYPRACIIIMGVFAIMHFFRIAEEMFVIADLIDEESPHFKKRIRMFTLRRGFDDAQFMNSLYRSYLSAVKNLGRCKKILLISHDEVSRFKRITRLREDAIEVSPNGVNLPELTAHHDNANYLIFHGTLNYYPNENAALFLIHKLAHLLYKKYPEFKIMIAGRYPTERLLRDLPDTKNVILIGEVADVTYYLQRSFAAIVPLFSRTGMQNKVLEAWACGIPVIATSNVYNVFHAFSPEVQNCMLSADSAHQILDRVSMLVGNPALRGETGAQGRLYVSKHFSWDAVVKRIHDIYLSQQASR